MLSSLTQGSPATIGFLLVCFALVLAFEFSNGFHDAANSVATAIYTKSLEPVYAVDWSGITNFLGVIFGGVAVAFALVELIPPDVLSPPGGGVAAGMFAALFTSALFWNVGTWWLKISNSSSHAIIGALIGIAVENSLAHARGLGNGVDWAQVGSVLSSLLLSPIIGFVLALLLFQLLRLVVHDERIYQPPEGETPPVQWMRGLLILTCSGIGTMVGYQRIVETLGERLGNQPLSPAQGALAEVVAAVAIGGAGFGGFPVSTTHVVTGGISGAMVGSGAGLQKSTLWRIATAWILTLPATIALSAGILYVLS